MPNRESLRDMHSVRGKTCLPVQGLSVRLGLYSGAGNQLFHACVPNAIARRFSAYGRRVPDRSVRNGHGEWFAQRFVAICANSACGYGMRTAVNSSLNEGRITEHMDCLTARSRENDASARSDPRAVGAGISRVRS